MRHELKFFFACFTRELGMGAGIICAFAPKGIPPAFVLVAVALLGLFDAVTALIFTKDYSLREQKEGKGFWVDLAFMIPVSFLSYWIWSGASCLLGHYLFARGNNLSESLALRMHPQIWVPCVLLSIPGSLWRPLKKVDLIDKVNAPIYWLGGQVWSRLRRRGA